MAIQQPEIFLKTFPEAKSVVVSGDIHGDFNELVFKMCEQYQMKNTLLIVAGDCGFGYTFNHKRLWAIPDYALI